MEHAVLTGSRGSAGTREFEKITTQDFVCIAQTVTKEITKTKDAEVHADASMPPHQSTFIEHIHFFVSRASVYAQGREDHALAP